MTKELFDFKARPITAWLNVNRQCNFRCKWCYGNDTGFSSEDTMSFQLAERLIHICKDIGVEHVIFIGGEPTLWKDLFDANYLCHELGMTTGLITNAALFGNDNYWTKYLSNEVDRLSISIKAADFNTFKESTGSEMFDITRLGVQRAISESRSNNSDKAVFITTVFNELVGMQGFKRIVDWSQQIGAEHFIVTLCSPTAKGQGVNNDYSIPFMKLSQNVVEITDYLNRSGLDYQIDVQMPLCLFPDTLINTLLEKKSLQTICHVFDRSGISFTPQGDISPCNELFGTIIAKLDEDYSDGKSLIEYLNGDTVISFYKELLRYPSMECDDCDRNIDCRGGCLMNWFVYEPTICHAYHSEE